MENNINRKIAVIIPARYASTRFQGKPLAYISGKPMIQRVYESAVKAFGITDVIVATDDHRIKSVVEAFGGKAVMTSEKNRSGTDRAADAADQLNLFADDIIINVQGDQPLLDSRCLEQLIAPFLENQQIEMTTLAFKIINKDEITNPKDVKLTFDSQGFALYFSRSPIPFGRDTDKFDTFKHLGVYAYTRRFLEIFRNLPAGKLESIEKLEQLRAIEYGHKIKVVVTEYDSPEVDLPDDIARIEKLLNSTSS
ncbi:3-deoxy-manno-octulosonate cytidylyltransferase [Desulfonema limicola]|uniref:3-deoxy-manno-octulosonate cytidylyltransferase n=1 Tax=Desulfonema limicola TaxID=45656 RepID=A0A975BAR2_9BACT|nr:3-deoxy-manno-octulosonate cytidylyltransferase [Desulfonema limicola]QTA81725.1 3-deoxy-manno-octulosonate cytidylyltransferase [Desulfonema limicola]